MEWFEFSMVLIVAISDCADGGAVSIRSRDIAWLDDNLTASPSLSRIEFRRENDLRLCILSSRDLVLMTRNTNNELNMIA